MGITILGNVGKIIEDNHGEMYFDNAKKIVSAEQQPQQRVVEDIVPIEDKQVTSPAEPDLERLQKYFSNNYLTTRHAEYVAMIDICCGDFTDREKAYFAWKIYDTDTREKIKAIAEDLILNHNVSEFWVGHYGRFDGCCSSVIRELQKTYTDIKLELVIPYITKGINEYRELYYKDYDNISM